MAVTGVKAVFSGACRHVAIRAHLALLAAVLVPSCLGTASLSRHGPCVCWGGRAAPSACSAPVLVRHAVNLALALAHRPHALSTGAALQNTLAAQAGHRLRQCRRVRGGLEQEGHLVCGRAGA